MIFKIPKVRKLFGVTIPDSEWADKSLDLENTSSRVARMFRDELLQSYKPGAFYELIQRFTCFDSDGLDSMVCEGPIAFHSICSHHALSFSGEAFVGYIPGNKIIGASKISRVIEFYARMLQIQERLARQVADFLYEYAQARIVIVLLEGTHSCMGVRGVRQPHTKMITTAVRPAPGGEDDEVLRGVLDEFYAQIQPLRQR